MLIKMLLQIKETMHLLKMDWMNFQKNLKQSLSTKALTKNLLNNFIILNGSKCLYLGIFQNYLLFIPA